MSSRAFIVTGVLILVVLAGTQPVHAQLFESTVTFSLSGGENISHSFKLATGDALTLSYTVTSTNDTSCVEVEGSFEQQVSPGVASQNVTNYNQTIRPQLRTVWDQHLFVIPFSGKETITFSSCPSVPSCEAPASVTATYDLSLAVMSPPNSTFLTQVENVLFIVMSSGLALVALGLFLAVRKIGSRPNTGSPTIVLGGT